MGFQVTAEWDGHMWTAVVDGYPNVFTQAKRLDTIPPRLTEVLHLMAGIESDPGDFARTMDIRYDDDLGVQAAEVRDLRSQVEAEEAELAQKTTTVARALRGRGMSVRDIGTMTGLSHQRVQQLVQGQGAH